jgi:hypothetical protein
MRWRGCAGRRDSRERTALSLADPFAVAEAAYATIATFLQSEEAQKVKHSDLERQLEAMGRDLMRKLLQAHLELRQPGEAQEPVRDAEGTTLEPTAMHTRSLESIFGTVEVARTGYAAAGTPSLHPLDAGLNLPQEKCSLEVRRRAAIEATKVSFDEAITTLETYTDAHVLVDGNLTQINHLQRLAEQRNIPLLMVVDFVHVAQYVWAAAQAFFPGHEPEQDRWVRAHLLEILRGKASLVAAGMRRSATRRSLGEAERQPVDVCADYLLNYSPYLQYEKALAAGVPIATGVIEGACRYLVEDRMNVTGARWSLSGAEAVLRLRALRASDHFDAYWAFHEKQEYQRNHASQYADYHVPETYSPPTFSLPNRRRTLKIVEKKTPS